jgi:hypothetical protein
MISCLGQLSSGWWLIGTQKCISSAISIRRSGPLPTSARAQFSEGGALNDRALVDLLYVCTVFIAVPF